MTDNETLAYLAGLVDGEGYIGIRRMNRKDCYNLQYHARIQVRMVDEEAIALLASSLGGNYYKEKPHASKGRPLFCYQASDAKAEKILAALLPYLRVKKRNAETVLSFRDLQHRASKYRTKVVGSRNFPNKYGTIRLVPNLAFSDEYMEQCETLWRRCKELNGTLQGSP